MANLNINDLFMETVKKGVYSGPDSKRHNMPGMCVDCDRCKKRNIPASIGQGDVDLCLSCVSAMTCMGISKEDSKKQLQKEEDHWSSDDFKTTMMQYMFDSDNENNRSPRSPELRTLMMQYSFQPENRRSPVPRSPRLLPELRTLMMQDNFRLDDSDPDLPDIDIGEMYAVTRMMQSKFY